MDHKTWFWRKKSTDRVIGATAAGDKVNPPSRVLEDEVHRLLTEKVELETDLNNLNDKLSNTISELYAKDDLIKKHDKMARDAMEGWEKAEAKCLTLNQELGESLWSKTAGEERIAHLDAALKECTQQLHFVRDEQEQRFHDAVVKTTWEFEKSQMTLEEKLKQTSGFVARVSTENTQLSKALLAKEQSIEDLVKKKIHVEAEFKALVTRLEAMEKDNVSLTYEVRVLEKELEIRNEEREFNRRTADASHKQHLESVKKIARLESECQRLRLLVRKRLPGPAALAKMKSEVEFLSRDAVDRRRRSNSNPSGLNLDYTSENSPVAKKINFLTEQLCAVEEENKSLREALSKKANELQLSRTMYACTASKLSQVESHLDDFSKGWPILDSSASGLVSHDLSLASMSDVGSDDKASCPESWASALISELEHFKSGIQRGSPSSKTVGASDMNLMDDFVEMERLAIVSVDKQSESPCASTDGTTAIIVPLDSDLNGYSFDVTCKEIVPVSEFGSTKLEKEMSPHLLVSKAPGWLQDIVKAILEQSCVTRRRPNEILEDVKSVLASVKSAGSSQFVDARESTIASSVPNPLHISGLGNHAEWEVVDASCRVTEDALLADKSNCIFQSDLGKSLCKIIELIEGINVPSSSGSFSDSLSREDESMLPYKTTETTSGYVVRSFQWKASELSAVLQQFVHSCYELLNGKSNLTKFAQNLNSALDWTVNHCFSLQDVSSMKYAIKKRFDWDEYRSECAEFVPVGPFSEVDKLCLSQKQLSNLPTVAALNGHYNNCKRDELQVLRDELQVLRDEKKKLNDVLASLDSEKKDLEGRLQSAVDKSESLTNQLQDSQQTIESLRMESETLRRSKEEIEGQIENHKLMKEDLNTKLTVTKAELDDTRQNFACLEVELENKNNCYQELEAMCFDLQLQLESVKKDVPVNGLRQEDKQLRTEREITTASEQLAECQETILKLGKQLKALASPREAAMFDKVIHNPLDTKGISGTISTDAATTTASNIDSSNDAGATTTTKSKTITQRSSLLDQMMAEDNAKEKYKRSTKIKESTKTSSSPFITNEVIDHLEKILMLDGSQNDDVASKSLAIVPSKRAGGGGLWRKLLWRKKKSGCKKKPQLPLFHLPNNSSSIKL